MKKIQIYEDKFRCHCEHPKGVKQSRSQKKDCFAILAMTTIFALLYFFLLSFDTYAQGLVVMAKKVSGELPLEADNSAWNNASAIEIPLAPQVMAKPRTYESSVKNLKIRGLHNTKEMAFLLEWSDASEDSSLDVDKFSDAVALEFPSSAAVSKPHFAMGDKDNPVNIWFWKASWQNANDMHSTYATSDEFAGGLEAGNPVSRTKASPVENLIAQGFGSATDLEKADIQNIRGNGKWQSGKWSVVFKRPLASKDKFDVVFREGSVTPLSLAVWNGSEGDRGGRKVVSTWYYVALETEEKETIYFYPVLAFIGTLGIEAGIIMGIRRKRG